MCVYIYRYKIHFNYTITILTLFILPEYNGIPNHDIIRSGSSSESFISIILKTKIMSVINIGTCKH